MYLGRKNCQTQITVEVLIRHVVEILLKYLLQKKTVLEVLMRHVEGKIFSKRIRKTPCLLETSEHGLRTPGEEIAFTARPKIKSQSQIFRYSRSIFCLPHPPKISDFFDLCLHWVSVVRGWNHKEPSRQNPVDD